MAHDAMPNPAPIDGIAAVRSRRVAARIAGDRRAAGAGRDRSRSSSAAIVCCQLTMVVIYAIALLGLNILTGYNGQISLGHGAFYAIGAYTDRDPDGSHWDLPYWATIPIAGAVCFVVGLSVRPAGAAARRPLSRAGDLRARGRDAAAPEVQAASRMDRRRAGHRYRAELRAPFGLPLHAGPVALSVLARRCGRDVRARRLEPAARAVPAAPSSRSATIRSLPQAWASISRSTSR